jgi:spore coat polysaccharide biosynthesis protein SpsF
MSSQHRVVIMVVARMGSTRVPGKSLLVLDDQPVLWHVLEIAGRIRHASALCLATTDLPSDDPIAALAAQAGVPCYRGHAENVLDRLHGAAEMMRADVIVDIGGDCPLLDPEIISDAIADYLAQPCDYLNNYDPPTFPEGYDVNVVARAALDRAWREAIAPSQRIHPFTYLTFHPEQFSIRNYAMSPDLSAHHWSLDFPEDIELIRRAYAVIRGRGDEINLRSLRDLIDTDATFARLDAALQRPTVPHALWNSPGMVRDMHEDLVQLARMAHDAKRSGDAAKACQCYSEIMHITTKLAQSERQYAEADGTMAAKP